MLKASRIRVFKSIELFFKSIELSTIIFQKYWITNYESIIIWNYPTLSLLSFPESFYIDLLRQQGCIRNDHAAYVCIFIYLLVFSRHFPRIKRVFIIQRAYQVK